MNGKVLEGRDEHGNALFTAKSFWTNEVNFFFTKSGAEFWLWLIDEREGAKANR